MLKKHKNILILLPAVFFVCAAATVRQPKAVITGDEMEIIKNGSAVIFNGNAMVKRGDSSLKAERIVHDKANNTVEATGNIIFDTVTEKNEPLHATGQKARYSVTLGEGELSQGRPHVTWHVRESTTPVQIFADVIRFDKQREEITGEGGVEVISSSACAYAPRVMFMQRSNEAFLTGSPQPKIVYHSSNRGEYSADSITIFMKDHSAELKGNVHGILYDFKK
ncbi:MAG: hypothetical protein A2219_01915 [Elusimicrobia bacterium RIFOXYA2_FULL_50_26]|nr:MAG: hypothetical protein A2219_01915 [Elusimicrobia bacterium RIFOXYA2_FULL_50_26]OGS24016.1 MAG: hypothetical protein A2314_02535 [Elusimicrobia bacterium RIFOXYB2_FULL_50_12]